MPAPKHILIAGGGPAGALAGEHLARAGFAVTIFEERRGWEKPCGGGVTWKTLERYPFLLDGALEKKLVRRAELIAPSGRRAAFDLTRPLALYSRAALNEFLLRRAEAAGCRVVPARVTAAAANGVARLRTTQGEFAGDFLVVATGARNALALPGDAWRPARRDLELTFGYYLPDEDDRVRVQFLEDFEGYLWSFPRADHLAVGVCGKMSRHASAELKDKLHRFLAAEDIPLTGGTSYSHLLPALARDAWKRLPLAGPGWARAGDAAGLVDPITGEGIYYALRSGELLAESLAAGATQSYPARVEKDFARELGCAARWQPTFYCGRWLGASTTERMVEAAGRSRRFRRLLDDLFAGSQGYRGLKWRLAGMLLPSLA
jgi:flavin-dependent dehydrogenase